MNTLQQEFRSRKFSLATELKNDLFNEIWNFAEEGFCILNKDYTVLKTNKSFCDFFSLSKFDFENKNLKTDFAYNPELLPALHYIFRMNGNRTITFEKKIISRRRNTCTENTFSKFFDNDGNLFYLWSIKSKPGEKEEEKDNGFDKGELDIILNSIGDGIILTNLSGLVTRMNPEAERLTGWGIHEAKGKNFNEIFRIVSEVSGGEIKNPLEQILTEQIKTRYLNNTILISRANVQTPVAYIGNPIHNSEGNIYGAVIVFRDETETHQKKKLLEESEARFSSIFHSGLAGITISSPETGIFIDVNKRFLQVTGYSREEIIGSSSTELGFWSDKKTRNHFVEILSAYGKAKNVEIEFKVKSGEKRIGQVSAELLEINGETLLLSIINDVTENVQAELALRSSQAQLSSALQVARLGHWELDNRKMIFTFNDQFYRMLGTSAELEGGYSMPAETFFNRFVHPEDLPRILETVAKETDATKDNVNLEFEHRILHKNGETSYAVVRLYVQKDNEGNPIKSYGITQDITKRRLVEQAREMETEKLNVTLRNIRDGVISTDSEDNIILTNQAITDITGWKDDELNGKSIVEFFEILNTDFNSFAGKSRYSTLFGMNENDKSVTSEALEIESKDGSKKVILCNSAKIEDTDSNLKGYVYVIKDITEQVEIETQLHLSQKMESVGQLAAGIAHEINTPMQYIMDNTLFIKESFENLKKYIELYDKFITENNLSEEVSKKRSELDLDFLLEEIPSAISQTESGIERVSKIVLAMKDFSHPGQNEKVLADINHGIEVTAAISRNEWKYFADLELNLNGNMPPVLCNIDEINQVILNMIVNAAHAIQDRRSKNNIEDKGKITITTSVENEFVLLEIKDTGSGIPDEIKQKIFDPFFTTKEVGKGTGQGLAIAHTIIIKNHNGTIDVDSDLNQGTTFRIRIPV
jgi:two-component system, NtrC family, sensor kinase